MSRLTKTLFCPVPPGTCPPSPQGHGPAHNQRNDHQPHPHNKLITSTSRHHRPPYKHPFCFGGDPLSSKDRHKPPSQRSRAPPTAPRDNRFISRILKALHQRQSQNRLLLHEKGQVRPKSAVSRDSARPPFHFDLTSPTAQFRDRRKTMKRYKDIYEYADLSLLIRPDQFYNPETLTHTAQLLEFIEPHQFKKIRRSLKQLTKETAFPKEGDRPHQTKEPAWLGWRWLAAMDRRHVCPRAQLHLVPRNSQKKTRIT